MLIPEALELAQLQRTGSNQRSIEKSYKLDAEMILKQIKPKNMLDIGCGIGGVECFIPNCDFFLIDRTQKDNDIYYGYKEKTSFYNSMHTAINQIASVRPGAKVYIWEADNTIPFQVEFDLIISLISCGFHYPVETYLEQIYQKLRKEGKLIIDLRKGTTNEEVCEKRFGNKRILEETKKYRRCMFTK